MPVAQIGTWDTQLKRLREPLSGKTDWIAYAGTSVVKQVSGQRANPVELDVRGPAGHIAGLSLRLYQPASGQWTLHFANLANGKMTDAMTGAFSQGIGTFYGQDSANGRVVFVRFLVIPLNRDQWRFEQAYSADGGKTWEDNWIAIDQGAARQRPANCGTVENSATAGAPLSATTKATMRLIGMLDSPYVRRVAISLDLLGIAFEHESISVFSTFVQFHAINPVVKAPTLVCDDGAVLMDSSLILQFVEARAKRSLWSADASRLQHEFCAVSLALAGCEKGAQIVYERNLRPKEAQYEPWMARVNGQLLAAFGALEQEVQRRPDVFADAGKQAAITAAVVWGFTQAMLAPQLPAAHYPGLARLAGRLEQTAPFLKYPADGPGVAGL